MAKLSVYNMKKEAVDSIELNDLVFGAEYNEALIHQVVVAQHNNARQGTKSTLTRSEVNASKKKMYRQKGTGGARHDERSAPQFDGGGVVFAPKPRSYRYSLPKKLRRLAMLSALSSKVAEKEIIVIDEIKFEEPKTKEMVKMLEAVKAEKKALIVTAEKDYNVVKSAANIPGVRTALVTTMNVYDIINHTNFIVTKEAVEKIEEVYS